MAAGYPTFNTPYASWIAAVAKAPSQRQVLWVHSRAFTLKKDVRNDEAHINNYSGLIRLTRVSLSGVATPDGNEESVIGTGATY